MFHTTDSSKLHHPLMVLVSAAVLAFAWEVFGGAAMRGNDIATGARPPPSVETALLAMRR